MARFVALAVAAVIVFALAGCSWQQLYSAGQEWQRNSCNRLIEATERERCLNSNSIAYDDYRRRTETPKKD
jgi:hypothetical protein